jgi:hypothetical protein
MVLVNENRIMMKITRQAHHSWMKGFGLLLLLIAGVFWHACDSNKELLPQYTLNGKLMNHAHQWLMIYRLTPDDIIVVDSVELEDDGSFVMDFEGIQSPDLFILQVKNHPWRITLLLEDGEQVNLKGDAFYLNKGYEVTGSPGSILLQNLYSTLDFYVNQADSIYFDYRTQATDSNSLSLRKQTDSLLLHNYTQAYNFVEHFCRENKNNVAALMGLYSRFGEEMILSETDDFELFDELAQSLQTQFPDNTHVLALVEFVSSEKARKKHQKEVEKQLEAGNLFPTIELKTPEGEVLSTQKYRGKHLLVSFWNSKDQKSWDMNTTLKEIASHSNPQKLSILSVGMDRDKLVWVNTIALDKLEWEHVIASESTFDQFNLHHTGRLFLIDPEGKILAKDPGNDSIKSLVYTYLNID